MQGALQIFLEESEVELRSALEPIDLCIRQEIFQKQNVTLRCFEFG